MQEALGCVELFYEEVVLLEVTTTCVPLFSDTLLDRLELLDEVVKLLERLQF
jgi:hypothetical protein